MKLIYNGTELAAAVLEGDEIRLVTHAITRSLPNANWMTSEREHLNKLLAELEMPAPE